MESKTQTQNKILIFLALTFAFSSVFYLRILQAGSMQTDGGLNVAALMWCPGLAAILTQLWFHRSLKGLGWRPGKGRYLLLGYLVPLLYGLITYSVVWLTGLGKFPNAEFLRLAQVQYAPGSVSAERFMIVYVLLLSTAGVLQSSLTALGEEIGWRGLLVPELAKGYGLLPTALISGGIWAAWHSPILLLGDYNNGAPAWYSLVCFTLIVLAISVVFAWLRLKSGSLWPAVLLHASHNLFIQGIFDPLTADTGITRYVTGEFGFALVIGTSIVAYLFWRRRSELTGAPKVKRAAPAKPAPAH